MIYFIGKEELFASDKYQKATLEDLLKWIEGKKRISVDTETEGFFDFKNRVIMLQIGDRQDQFVIDTRCTDVAILKKYFEDPNVEKLFWNAKFDINFMRFSFDWKTVNVYDGFLAECILTTGLIVRDLSLENAANVYCNKKLNKDERNKFVGLKGKPFTDMQIIYGAEDIQVLEDIKEKQISKIEEYKMQSVLKLENNFVIVLADVEYRGFKLDRDKWLALDSQNKEVFKVRIEKLNNYVLSDPKLDRFVDNQLDLFNSGRKCAIEWSSSRQVVALMKFLGIDTRTVDKKTGKPKDSVEAKHLKKFEGKYPIIPIYLEYKEIEKQISTYGEEFLKHINPITGRVHSNYWQILDTGRISSSDPNLQNIPADEGMRACFVPEEGNILTVSDYSAQEPRVTADRCKDPALIDFFLHGDGDIHSLVASKVFTVINGKETKITKKNNQERQTGKILGLALDYGASAFSLKDSLKTTEQEAQKFIDAYFAAFPGKKDYFRKCIDQAMRDGYILIDPVTNRRSWCSNFEEIMWCKEHYNELDKEKRSEYFKRIGSLKRNAQNYPIQGTSGSMTKVAAVLIHNEFQKLKISDKAFIVNLVHDEIVTEETIELQKVVEQIVRIAMIKAGELFCKTVPMTVEPNSSKVWKK